MIVILCAVALAGCTEDEGAGPDDPDAVLKDPDAYYAQHHCVVNDVRPRVLAPDGAGTPWVIGDWWDYEIATSERAAARGKLVYYADQDLSSTGVPQHYMVGTKTYAEALDHAVWSTNPVVGRIHRLLYSPHEEGVHADMFNFPVCAGNSWSTTFFDRTFQLKVTATQITLPDGTRDAAAFRIDGTAPDGSTIWYTYSPKAKWFTELHLDRADGKTVDMGLKALGSGESGTFYFLRGQKDEGVDVATMTQTVTIHRAAGAEGAYDRLGLYLELVRQSGDGRVELILEDPQGNQVACVGVAGSGLGGATDCPAGPLQQDVAWQAGEWTLRLERPPLSQSTVSGEVRIVSIYDRSGSTG